MRDPRPPLDYGSACRHLKASRSALHNASTSSHLRKVQCRVQDEHVRARHRAGKGGGRVMAEAEARAFFQ